MDRDYSSNQLVKFASALPALKDLKECVEGQEEHTKAVNTVLGLIESEIDVWCKETVGNSEASERFFADAKDPQ